MIDLAYECPAEPRKLHVDQDEAGGRAVTPPCTTDAPASGPITVERANAIIDSVVDAVPGIERLPLSEASGRILADPIHARAPVPPFDSAAMDGYALRYDALTGSGPWRLPVRTSIPAGRSDRLTLERGAAVEIFTGAPVPAGADTIIVQEDVAGGDGHIAFGERPDRGANIRRAAEQVRQGDRLVVAGTRLRAAHLGAIATAGHNEISARRRVRAAIVTTGDEIRHSGADLGPAAIWNTNAPMLRSALEAMGAEIAAVAHCGDDQTGMSKALAAISNDVDIIVTTGGISVGRMDLVRPALADLGARFDFSGVAIKPGKPVSIGRLGGAVWLGLPGNPGAAYATWMLLGRRILDRLMGRERSTSFPLRAVLSEAVKHKIGRCELRPATVKSVDPSGRLIVVCSKSSCSASILQAADSDGLAVLPADVERLPEGALINLITPDDL